MKQVRRFCLVLLFSILVLAVGCTTIQTTRDEFDGYTINRMIGNELGGGFLDLGTTLYLNPERYVAKNGQISYSLRVGFLAHNWLFIERGESLILLVDGERMGFRGKGSWSHRDIGILHGTITEKAWYNVTPEQLKKIAYANSVKVKVVGSQHHIKRGFTKENFSNFRRFCKEYIESYGKE